MTSFQLSCLWLLASLCTIPSTLAAELVWWEGERVEVTNFPPSSYFSPGTFRDTAHLLSEGQWLSTGGLRGKDELHAMYRVEVPADGSYHFWCRKFWKHGPFKWRFRNDSDWRECGRDVALADDTYLRKHLNANWVYLGKVDLKKGPRIFELRLLTKEGEDSPAGFDCFVLTTGVFIPNGRYRPGERSGLADEGFFPYEPSADDFRNDSPIDLRHLNEKTAGQSGFLRADRDRILLGDGTTPARFWAVNVSTENINQSRDSIDYFARKLAKLGVNMVRFHSAIFKLDDPGKVEIQYLDNLHYFVAAMKREGIYTELSFYFPLWYDVTPETGIDGFGGDVKSKKPFALLFFDERLQQIYKSAAKKLLDSPNPYTKLTLAQDPGVGIVEILNEDSLFFYTFAPDKIPPAQWAKLEAIYAKWLESNGGDGAPAKIVPAWAMTRAGMRQSDAKTRDAARRQARFLAELQRGFYASMARYFKEDLHVGGLVSASNWSTADATLLDPIERWTYTAADLMDVHSYFSGEHRADGDGYLVRAGHSFKSLAAVTVPDKVPLNVVQVEDRPQLISELGWSNPNLYRADGPMLTAAYASLQGFDGLMFFASASNYFQPTRLNKYGLEAPVIGGAFPAAALAYRRGDVRQAEPVVRQALRLDDLFALGGSPEIDPLAWCVGPVVRAISHEPFGESSSIDLSQYIDRQNGTVTSRTKELIWNWSAGVIRVDSPNCQGAAGFLRSAGRIELRDVTIECSNDFAAVWAIALDDLPLALSKKILIQVTTQEQPYGFKVDGEQITSMGERPFGMRKIQCTVTLDPSDGAVQSITALDENGYPRKDKVTVGAGSQIRLTENALYHVVTR